MIGCFKFVGELSKPKQQCYFKKLTSSFKIKSNLALFLMLALVNLFKEFIKRSKHKKTKNPQQS